MSQDIEITKEKMYIQLDSGVAMSPTLGKLAAALAKAQGEIVDAKKGSENPFFKSRYADLTSVWDACRKQLTSNGLSVIQTPQTHPSGAKLTTTLLHSSGEWVSGSLVLPLSNKGNAQDFGSALTYARRYALSATVGVAPDDDDDGNAASGKSANSAASFNNFKAKPLPASRSANNAPIRRP